MFGNKLILRDSMRFILNGTYERWWTAPRSFKARGRLKLVRLLTFRLESVMGGHCYKVVGLGDDKQFHSDEPEKI